MTTFVALREKLQLSSTHPDLHKTIYALCLPPLIVAVNALSYYLLHNEASLPESSSPWTLGTSAAPAFSLIANIAATVVFVMFTRHRRVHSQSRVAVSFTLTLAWLCTFVSFLVVE